MGQKKGQLRIKLQTSTDDERPVYLAGTFNKWRAEDERFRMHQTKPGQYEFTFEQTADLSFPLQYKYLRGGWEEVELDSEGRKTPNRVLEKPVGTVRDKVSRWHWEASNPKYLPIIKVISEAFEIPQLIKTRRIAAIVPYDYHQSNRRYPVLYLQDGQNLFDDYAPFGNWGVDKKLSIMAERGLHNLIVIAIDHAAEERIVEFTPTETTRLGTGDGRKYVRFLKETLKPFVDKHFRTLPDHQHTGIGGSSMGGLISIYAGLIYPQVYGRLLIFSPSLWVAPNIHFNAIRFLNSLETKIYLYAGGKEGANMLPNVERFRRELQRQGYDDSQVQFYLSFDPQGLHNEARWGAEFPKAIEWLYFTPSDQNDNNDDPNPTAVRESGQ